MLIQSQRTPISKGCEDHLAAQRLHGTGEANHEGHAGNVEARRGQHGGRELIGPQVAHEDQAHQREAVAEEALPDQRERQRQDPARGAPNISCAEMYEK